jgi:DnaJ-domain-containing protein 1
LQTRQKSFASENKEGERTFWAQQKKLEADLRSKRESALLEERARREEEQREHIERLERQRIDERSQRRAVPGDSTVAPGSGIHESSDMGYVLQSLQGATPSQILDVHPSSSDTTIKKAYRKLALQYHPDRNETADAPLSAEIFKLISGAYSTLVRS